MSYTIDLYGILGLTIDATQSEIKKKYRELAKKYHPDKGGNDKLYEMITYAYNVLSDSTQRQEYDMKLIEKKEDEKLDNNFSNLRDKFNRFMEDQNSDIVSKDRAPEEFKKKSEEMNKKHGFDSDNLSSNLSEEELSKRLKELQFSRRQDDIESEGPLFDPKDYAPDKFNAIFDGLDKTRKDLIVQEDPIAWNLTNCAYSEFKLSTYEDIYAEDKYDGNALYSSINRNNIAINSKDIDINKITSASYYKNHNNIDIDYEKLLKERLDERVNFDRNLKKQETRNKKQ